MDARKASSEIAQALLSGKKPLIFLDFDGTLAQISRRPDTAKMSRSMRSMLRRLSRHAYVVVISGRKLSDLQRRVAIRGISLAGNHGFEWSAFGSRGYKAVTWGELVALDQARYILRHLVQEFSGASLEDKGFTMSVHYRLVEKMSAVRFRRLVYRSLRAIPSARHLRLQRGKKIIEVRPASEWGKGACAHMLLRKKGARPTMYIGDDETDESAFSALKKHGATIRIGTHPITAAQYRLPNQSAVGVFLRAVLRALDRGDVVPIR